MPRCGHVDEVAADVVVRCSRDWQVDRGMAGPGAAGTQVLVTSGVIDPEHGHDFADAAVDAKITFCHLTVRARSACSGSKLPNRTRNLHKMIIG